MRRNIPFLLLALSTFLTWPTASVCVPKNSSVASAPGQSLAPGPSLPSLASPPRKAISDRPPSQAPSPSLSPTSLPAFPLSEGDGAESEIEAICKQTDNPDVCLSSIQTVLQPTSLGLVDARSVLKLQMKACQAKTEEAKAAAYKLETNPETDPRDASRLQDCSDNYDDALDNLDAAATALDGNDKGTMNSMLSALIDDYSTCDDGFGEMGATSPMATHNNLLTELASNCLAIAESI